MILKFRFFFGFFGRNRFLGVREELVCCLCVICYWSWGFGWRVVELYLREFNDVVYKGNDGGFFCCCVFINEFIGVVFGYDELWRETGY